MSDYRESESSVANYGQVVRSKKNIDSKNVVTEQKKLHARDISCSVLPY